MVGLAKLLEMSRFGSRRDSQVLLWLRQEDPLVAKQEKVVQEDGPVSAGQKVYCVAFAGLLAAMGQLALRV